MLLQTDAEYTENYLSYVDATNLTRSLTLYSSQRWEAEQNLDWRDKGFVSKASQRIEMAKLLPIAKIQKNAPWSLTDIVYSSYQYRWDIKAVCVKVHGLSVPLEHWKVFIISSKGSLFLLVCSNWWTVLIHMVTKDVKVVQFRMHFSMFMKKEGFAPIHLIPILDMLVIAHVVYEYQHIKQ